VVEDRQLEVEVVEGKQLEEVGVEGRQLVLDRQPGLVEVE